MSSSAFSQLVDFTKNMIPKDCLNQPWIVAVSGGADSVCLVRVLQAIQPNLILAHVNYKKRDLDSDLDEVFVHDLANELQLLFESITAPKFSGGNFQEWARDIRYSFFDELQRKYSARLVALAHHEDDQKETQLFRWLRRSSAESRLGMKTWNEPYFRPFLSFPKSFLVEVLRDLHQPWREDVSNQQTDYFRNWLRLTMIPELDNRHPNWAHSLTELARFEQRALNSFVELSKDTIQIEYQLLKIYDVFFELIPQSIQSDVVLFLLDKAGFPGVSTAAVRSITELLQHQKGKKWDIHADCEVVRETGFICFQKKMNTKIETSKWIYAEHDWNSQDFSTERLEKPPIKWLSDGSLYVDVDKLRYPIRTRVWQTGDTFQPLGMQGHRLVSDFITDCKIPHSSRNDVRVVLDFDDVIQAVIFAPPFSRFNRIAESVKCSASSRKILRISPKQSI
jgi:tRNA(Ile)-lysidine synthase